MAELQRAGFRAEAYPPVRIEKFRRTLQRMRDLACAELGGLVEMIPEESRNALGTGTLREADGQLFPGAEIAAAEAEQERLMAYLDALEGALDRIAEGGYGRCSTCGEVISEDRLAGLPCAKRCSRCLERELHSSPAA